MILVRYEAAKRALMEARSIDEVKEVRDKAAALRLYAKQAGESLEMQNAVAEIKLRAERRAGELLEEMDKNPGGRPPENLSHDVTGFDSPTLTELGIGRMQAHRWQVIARLPEEQFERHLSGVRARNAELTTAGVLRVAKEQSREQLKTQRHAREAEVMATLPERRWQVHTADMRIWQAGQLFDYIITDPPYPREYLPLYGDLAIRATEWLKPGGSCLVMCGQSYLPEIMRTMTAHLSYHWTVAYLTPGGQAAQLWQRKVNTFWKPILWFVNGEKYRGPWVGDVARSAVNDNDKTFHRWGQSESGMADLIERFTMPGDTILDPFMGAGTTGVVAAALGRLFVGIDINSDAVATARGRLSCEV